MKRLIVWVLSISILWTSFYVRADENTPAENLSKELYAQSALLLDAENGRVLFEKNGYTQMPMASTTKIMTLIVALEYGNLDDIVTVSHYASTMPDVQLNIKEGEQYYLRDLLYSLMLESHNDSAVAIAEHIGGSVEGFAALMNEKARDIGAYCTNFVTPNGLDNEEHYTTAFDLALITRYALEKEAFIQITNTRSYSFSEVNGARSFQISNRNAFLDSYDCAIGVKTGFTGNAGYCFVGAVQKDGKTLISVVLACGWPPNKTYKWHDTKLMMDYGFENYTYQQVLTNTYQQLPKVSVLNGLNENEVGVYYTEEIGLNMAQAYESVDYIINLPAEVEAPVKKNAVIGSIDVYIGDHFYRKVNLYADRYVKRIQYSEILKEILYQYFLS